MPRIWLFMLGKDSYLQEYKQFFVYAFYRYPRNDSLLYDCILNSMARVQSVDDKDVFVFVCDANIYHSELLESFSPVDRHGRDALHFCNLPVL